MRVLFFFSCFFVFLQAGVTAIDITPKDHSKHNIGIKILDQKQLSFEQIDGVKFAELSDVAYHKKTEILYFVGDKGMLYSFRAKFSDHIDVLKPLNAATLKTKKSKRLKKWKRDSEGLTLDGKGRLLISFEGDYPKIGWFHKNSNAYGNHIRTYRLPKLLRDAKNYRSKNKSLEAIAWHMRYGILTATEWAVKKDNKKKQTIYSLSGKKWHFNAEPESKSAVVSMEVMDDGNLLVLERSYTGILDPFVVTLKKVYINNCRKKMCRSEVLVKMNSHKGWDVDNFEGLARVGKNRYVMVSDNGDNFFQKTLLIYFEVL